MGNFSETIRGGKPVLIDFFAEWCNPCKVMSPILKEVKQDLGEAVIILKIDVDKNPKIAATYQIRGVPTFLLFKEGKLLWRQSGMINKNDLIDIINQHI
ncbi:thioredoxin [Tenacibaculum sp. UWU-22]|uniref:thioredoxin n=1 Tax=Tenacibaculum sp. UWU-22 TaxID=3234187 RepID=UPI0034DACC18